MSRPAFFVDGQTEQRALQQLCSGNPIRLIGCNGKTVSMSAVAKRLATHIKLLNNRNFPIVVIIDREAREESAEEVKKELLNELGILGIEDEILIGVCDRMIENWILADRDNFKKYINRKSNLPKVTYEGTKGKSEVKKIFPEYHETTDGVTLLATSNPEEMNRNSTSFNSFVKTIAELPCTWLENLWENN
ncbi:DUF4276 family protein [Maribacter sp. 2210JD10-5]|uniref:DUF4276 family protein n=1 Tax=Maribacter sp. 2210JD10-5 TaxID=3386272 RepID=UPI0039BD2D6E